MEISNGSIKLSELEEGKWYYLKNHSRDHNNEITGIMIEDNWINIKLSGWDFKEDFNMKFEYSQAALNEMYQYDFQENYKHPIDKTIDDLNWVNDIATIPYTMCTDLHYTPTYVVRL